MSGSNISAGSGSEEDRLIQQLERHLERAVSIPDSALDMPPPHAPQQPVPTLKWQLPVSQAGSGGSGSADQKHGPSRSERPKRSQRDPKEFVIPAGCFPALPARSTLVQRPATSFGGGLGGFASRVRALDHQTRLIQFAQYVRYRQQRKYYKRQVMRFRTYVNAYQARQQQLRDLAADAAYHGSRIVDITTDIQTVRSELAAAEADLKQNPKPKPKPAATASAASAGGASVRRPPQQQLQNALPTQMEPRHRVSDVRVPTRSSRPVPVSLQLTDEDDRWERAHSRRAERAGPPSAAVCAPLDLPICLHS